MPGESGKESSTPIVLSLALLTGFYKSSPLFQRLPARTRKSYDAALRLVSQHELKDKRRFGMLLLSSITPGAADRLFDKLRRRPDGGDRIRTAVLSVTVCKRAWNVARRDRPKLVPWENPFQKMEISQREEDIIGRLSWTHYRPVDAPDVARIFHHKTVSSLIFHFTTRTELCFGPN